MNASLSHQPRTSRFVRFGIVTAFLFVSIAVVAAFAKPAIVKMKNGQSYEGDLVENGDSITVTIRGVETKLARKDIASITYQAGTFKEQFEQRRAKLAANDVAGRIALARFAMENKAYDAASEVIDEAVTLDPENAEAISLRETIRRQVHAEKTPGAGEPAPPATNPNSGAIQLGPIERRYLNPDQIQIIRQGELKPGDTARVQIPNEVRRDYATKSGQTFSQFANKTQVEQALAILDDGTDEMKKQVKVVSDPDAIVEFKRLQPMLLTGCAAITCHGGNNGAGFILFNPADSEPATYTNFYICNKYSKKTDPGGAGSGGFFGGPSEKKMIDRGKGQQSLLVQFGLPPTKADSKHPHVAGYNGVFHDETDPRIGKLVDWMNTTMKLLPPDYKKIDYKVPKGAMPNGGATPPATAPAAPPATKPAAGH